MLPKPYASQVVWATEDLIEQNPDLVRRFVKATLETVGYLKSHPDFAAEVYMKGTNAPKDLADRAISQYDWTPNGRGSGTDIFKALANGWQYVKDSGEIAQSMWEKVKIEDAVDTRFLP